MSKIGYRGLLAIGDPHLASRVPGFRKDEYPKVILRKLEWCLEYAHREQLLPCLLGDVFHWPRDNANWLLGAVLDVMKHEVLAISGNHDCAENTLGEDDSLSVIAKAGRLRLLNHASTWRGTINGQPVVVGGTPWGQPMPSEWRAEAAGPLCPLVFWLVHEDVSFPGYDAGRIEPAPIPGIDVVINGHIHHAREEVTAGCTTWLNPGNIARVKRSDSTRDSIPSVLRIDVDPPLESEFESAGLLWHDPGTGASDVDLIRQCWHTRRVAIPHEPFDQVFHAEVLSESIAPGESAFVHGLAELVARRTESGAGLREFLQHNVTQFDERVAQEIMNLAEEVLRDIRSSKGSGVFSGPAQQSASTV
jgi:predicted phosphodiesterase